MGSPKFSEDVRPLTDLKTKAGAVVDSLRRSPRPKPSWMPSARPMARKRKLLWSGPALEDLREIREYVARDKLAAAKKLVLAIRNSVLHLREHPHSGSRAPS